MLEIYQKFTFNYVYYKLNDYHDASDITSQVLALYCLKCNYLDDNSIKGWLINTSKNLIKKHYTKKSRENKTIVQYIDQLNHFHNEELSANEQQSLSNAFHEAFDALSKKDLDIMLLYMRCDRSIKKTHLILDVSYDSMRKKISRIKKKLKAETYKNMGYYGSKMIVTPELDNQIYQFLRRFKINLENDSLEKMHYYFSEIDIKDINKKFEINKIFDYEIELKNSIYKVWIFFKNKKSIGDSFYIEFYINENNYLKIITPPTRPQKVIVIQANSNEGNQLNELLNKYPIDKTGRPKIPKEEIEKIFKMQETKKQNSK